MEWRTALFCLHQPSIQAGTAHHPKGTPQLERFSFPGKGKMGEWPAYPEFGGHSNWAWKIQFSFTEESGKAKTYGEGWKPRRRADSANISPETGTTVDPSDLPWRGPLELMPLKKPMGTMDIEHLLQISLDFVPQVAASAGTHPESFPVSSSLPLPGPRILTHSLLSLCEMPAWTPAADPHHHAHTWSQPFQQGACTPLAWCLSQPPLLDLPPWWDPVATEVHTKSQGHQSCAQAVSIVSPILNELLHLWAQLQLLFTHAAAWPLPNSCCWSPRLCVCWWNPAVTGVHAVWTPTAASKSTVDPGSCRGPWR